MPMLMVRSKDCTGDNQARMRMAGSWQRYGIALLSAALVYAEPPPAGVGYLPRIGPTTLRFRPAPRRDAAVVLPPLQMSNESTNTPSELLLQPTEPAETEISDIDFEVPGMELFPNLGESITNAPTAGQAVMV